MKFRFTRLCILIMGDKKDYKVEIVQAVFYLREVEVSGSIKMEFLDNWIKEPY